MGEENTRQVAKAEEDKNRKRERTKAKKMTHRSWHWLLDVCRVRRTCRSCGQALSRARRVPGSRRTSWPPFNRGYRIREKRERLNEIVDDSLRTLSTASSGSAERTAGSASTETYFVLAALSAGPSLLSVRFTPRSVCIPRVGNYHHNERIVYCRLRAGCANTRRTMGPHTLITRILIPAPVPPRYRSPSTFPLVSTHESCTPI